MNLDEAIDYLNSHEIIVSFAADNSFEYVLENGDIFSIRAEEIKIFGRFIDESIKISCKEDFTLIETVLQRELLSKIDDLARQIASGCEMEFYDDSVIYHLGEDTVEICKTGEVNATFGSSENNIEYSKMLYNSLKRLEPC